MRHERGTVVARFEPLRQERETELVSLSYARRKGEGVFKLRSALALVMALAAAVAISASATAAPKTGCGAEASGWSEQSVEAAAATIWDGLLDHSPWPNGLPQFTEEIRGLDVNAEGNVCLKINWGERANENSHWFGVELFIAVDNNGNGSNR